MAPAPAPARYPAVAMSARARSSVHQNQGDDQGDEAVQQVDRDPSLLQTADQPGDALGDACQRQIQAMPDMIGHDDFIARLTIERLRQYPRHTADRKGGA